MILVQAAIPSSETPLQELKQQYVQSISTSRTQEQQFFVSREQYYQLRTLASLEEVTKASKTAQAARLQTLSLYFQTLLAYITEIKGLELQRKPQQQKAIERVLTDLSDKTQALEKAQDRVALDKQSELVKAQQETYTATAYETLALTKIALMQTAIDSLQSTEQKLKTIFQEQSLGALDQTQKQRGFDEVDRTIEEAQISMKNAEKLYTQATTGSTKLSVYAYTSIVDVLASTYTNVQQAENFLKELAQE